MFLSVEPGNLFVHKYYIIFTNSKVTIICNKQTTNNFHRKKAKQWKSPDHTTESTFEPQKKLINEKDNGRLSDNKILNMM